MLYVSPPTRLSTRPSLRVSLCKRGTGKAQIETRAEVRAKAQVEVLVEVQAELRVEAKEPPPLIAKYNL